MKWLSKLAASILLLLVWALASPASAHKVVLDVYADGDAVEGEIGFSSGDMAAGIVIEVFDDAGNKLGEATSDEDGIFRYKPTAKIPLVFRANLGAGHVASYEMGVDELPDGVGGDVKAEAASSEVSELLQDMTKEKAAKPSSDSEVVGLAPAALQKLIGAEVRAQLEAFKPEMTEALGKTTKPLRKVVADYMEKNDLQSILGGLGYILGLFGIGFYVAARRESKKAASARKETA